jgi:hypothetical protein
LVTRLFPGWSGEATPDARDNARMLRTKPYRISLIVNTDKNTREAMEGPVDERSW